MGESLSTDQQDSKTTNSTELPIIYTPKYNIGFMKLESLHPFDSKKYEKIYNGLINSKRVTAKQFIEPTECKENTLKLIHTQSYLQTLTDSNTVAKLVEVAPVAYLPNSLVQKYLLTPMRYATQGSLIAAENAYIKYGWAINLSGGYHHASAAKGGGFCIYSDISLIIVDLIKKYGHNGTDISGIGGNDLLKRIMILDLDAHQGNGHGTDKRNLLYKKCGAEVFTIDFYTHGIYPNDSYAKGAIDVEERLSVKTMDKWYLKKLKNTLPKYLDIFKPQFMIYNAGTDILSGDPLGLLDITENGVIERDYIVFNECFNRNIPVVMLLSGGYQQSNAGIITKSILNLDDRFELFKFSNKLNGSNQKTSEIEEKKSDQ